MAGPVPDSFQMCAKRLQSSQEWGVLDIRRHDEGWCPTLIFNRLGWIGLLRTANAWHQGFKLPIAINDLTRQCQAIGRRMPAGIVNLASYRNVDDDLSGRTRSAEPRQPGGNRRDQSAAQDTRKANLRISVPILWGAVRFFLGDLRIYGFVKS